MSWELYTELCAPDIADWRRSKMPELPEDQRCISTWLVPVLD